MFNKWLAIALLDKIRFFEADYEDKKEGLFLYEWSNFKGLLEVYCCLMEHEFDKDDISLENVKQLIEEDLKQYGKDKKE
jgi:hypothetical protein